MLKLAILAAVAFCAYGASLYENTQCSGERTLNYADLTLNKINNPIRLRKGETIEADFAVNIHKMFPEKFKVQVNLKKKVWFAWLTIPCVAQVGSCTYDVTCDQLEKMQKKHNNGKIEYQCPHPPGVISTKITKTLPDIPWAIRQIGSGDYSLSVRIYKDGERDPIACAKKDKIRVET